MGAGGRTIRSYAPARCDALGVGRRDDNMIDDLDIERSTKVGKPARRDDVVFARGRVAARVIVDENESGGAVLDRAPKDRSGIKLELPDGPMVQLDRKSTRLNSSH